LEDNGVTVTCESASVGDTSTIENGGKLYTKIDSKDDLTTEGGAVAPTNACTSGVTNMEVWFFFKTTFNEDISHWDTSSVTNMNLMFTSATAFNQNIGCWDTSSVRDMYRMFYGATAFNQDLKLWDVHLIPSDPGHFDVYSGFQDDTTKHPIWGSAGGSCNAAPTDITLSNASANQSSGTDATVGTLYYR